MQNMNLNKFSVIADQALVNYDFGDGVNVEATSGWEYLSGSNEVSCPVFLKFDNDGYDEDTHLATFNVSIEDEKIVCANCSYQGNLIGHMVF